MRVKEIMTRQVEMFECGLSVDEAVRRLVHRKISGLPVVDQQKKLVGMFTEKEILKFILPSYISKGGRFVYKNFGEEYLK